MVQITKKTANIYHGKSPVSIRLTSLHWYVCIARPVVLGMLPPSLCATHLTGVAVQWHQFACCKQMLLGSDINCVKVLVDGMCVHNDIYMHLSYSRPEADPGGCANSQNCYYFSNFCRKLHENERIWTPRERASLAPHWIRQCRLLLV